MADHVCVVDLGSNALRLVVFERQAGGLPLAVGFHRERVRLSEGMDAGGGALQPAAIERTLKSLRHFAATCDACDCAIVAVATSAVRDAANGESFLDAVAAETGLRMRVLTAAEEAKYAFLAARASLPVATGWVVEIGGGSAQVSIAADGRLIESHSAPLGAVRAFERYPLGDPPADTELAAMRRGLTKDLVELGPLPEVGGALIGISGTVKSLARVHRHQRGRGDIDIHGYRVPRVDADRITSELAALTIEQRKVVPGMDPDRADVILAGLILLDALMAAGGYEEVVVCRYGIREGIAWEALGSESGA